MKETGRSVMNPQALAGIRSRIVAHRRVSARDLKPHPLNPRTHGQAQHSSLRGLLQEIGLARSVLAYVADADRLLGEDAPLTLIDGHLRREELGDTLVDVEVVDVTDAEAKALLLSLDPLAQLAGYDAGRLDQLRATVEQDSAAVASLWAALDANASRVENVLNQTAREPPPGTDTPDDQFYVLIECRDEAEQVRLLQRFKAEGLRCSAKLS